MGWGGKLSAQSVYPAENVWLETRRRVVTISYPASPVRSSWKDIGFNRACWRLTNLAKESRAGSGWVRRQLLAVVADGLNRAAFEGFHAQLSIHFGGRLGMHERIPAFFMSLEKRRRGLAAQVAINALLVDVEFAGSVVFPLFSFVGHFAND